MLQTSSAQFWYILYHWIILCRPGNFIWDFKKFMRRLASHSPNLLEYLCTEFHYILIILGCEEKETKILSSVLVQNFKQASPASYRKDVMHRHKFSMPSLPLWTQTFLCFRIIRQWHHSYIFNINLSQFKDHHFFFLLHGSTVLKCRDHCI